MTFAHTDSFDRLIKCLSACCVLALVCACSTQPSAISSSMTQLEQADSANIFIEGRTFDVPEKQAIGLAYPGVSIHFTAAAEKLFMRAYSSSDQQYIDVLRNGERVRKVQLQQGLHSTLLWDSAEDRTKAASFEIVRASAPWQGTLELVGIELVNGAILKAKEAPTRKLLFIGDSITSGSVSDPLTIDEPKNLQSNNGRFSYGKLTARELDAQAHLVSYGGRGLIRDWEGKDNSQTNNAPVFYPRAHPDDSQRLWDHNQYQADAVVINLGTNDFNQGIPDSDTFVSAYVTFARQIRSDYPSAHIFLMLSPMHGVNSSERKALDSFITKTIQQLGDANISKLDVSYYPGRNIDPHPVKEEHQAMADEIAPVIARTLGW